MEALAALGVASSATQFVDFTWKLITETHTIRKSADGVGDDALLLDTVLNDVEHLIDQLEKEKSLPSSLQKLVSQSCKIAAELRAAIQLLKADKKNSTWASFQAALRQVSKKGELESLTNNLSHLQSQIAQHVLVELRYGPIPY